MVELLLGLNIKMQKIFVMRKNAPFVKGKIYTRENVRIINA